MVLQGLNVLVFNLVINVKTFAFPGRQNIYEHETLLENKVLFINVDAHGQLLG